MKIENLKWMVWEYDSNAKKIEQRNVFKLSVRFNQDLEEIYEDYNNGLIGSYKEFEKRLVAIARYSFWSKCEHELILKPWVGDNNAEIKFDVYDQIHMNWKHFCKYVWKKFRKSLAEA